MGTLSKLLCRQHLCLGCALILSLIIHAIVKGWVGSIPIGLATSCGVFVTPLVSRFKNRSIAVAGVFMCFASCIVTSFMTSLPPMYLTYSILYGFGVGFSSLSSMDLLLRYFPNKNCSRATSLSLVGSSSGMLALGPLIYHLIAQWGWRNMLRCLGSVLLLIGLPATMTFSRPTDISKPEKNDKSAFSISVEIGGDETHASSSNNDITTTNYDTTPRIKGFTHSALTENDCYEIEQPQTDIHHEINCGMVENCVDTMIDKPLHGTNVMDITTGTEINDDNHDTMKNVADSKSNNNTGSNWNSALTQDNQFDHDVNDEREPKQTSKSHDNQNTTVVQMSTNNLKTSGLSTNRNVERKTNSSNISSLKICDMIPNPVVDNFKEERLQVKTGNNIDQVTTSSPESSAVLTDRKTCDVMALDLEAAQSLKTHRLDHSSNSDRIHVVIKESGDDVDKTISRPPSELSTSINTVLSECTDNHRDVDKTTLSMPLSTNVAEINVNNLSNTKLTSFNLKVDMNDKSTDTTDLRLVTNPRTFDKLRTLLYPELWFISFALIGLTMTITFYYINLGDFLLSVGFEKTVIPWAVTTLGVSEVVGKILLAAFADSLPFPKIFLYNIACFVGIAVMGCLLIVNSVAFLMFLAFVSGMIVMMLADALAYSICNQVFKPEDSVQTWTFVMVAQGIGYMLGSLFGESIDRTGSYDFAIYACIAIYGFSNILWLAVPLYQKYFARQRFIMFKHQAECRGRRSLAKT